MGACWAKFRTTTIDVIPDKAVMLDIVDRIVEFENMLKMGETVTKEERKEMATLEPVVRSLKKARGKRPVVKVEVSSKDF